MPQVPKTPLLDPNASYLINGGLDGLGRSMTRYLVRNGGKYIILASRSGITNLKVQSLVNELAGLGAKVVAYQCDVGQWDQVEKLVHESSKDMPPIRGVIHGAMVLHVRPNLPLISRYSESNQICKGCIIRAVDLRGIQFRHSAKSARDMESPPQSFQYAYGLLRHPLIRFRHCG